MRMRRACYWLHGRAACTERRVAAQRPRALPGRAACVPRRTAPRAGGGFAAGPTLAPAAPARRAPARTGRAPAPRPLTAPGRRAQIAVGDEGYLVGGSSWLDNGSKGDDWAGNLQDPNIAFGTVHICARPPAACPACPRLPRRRGERQRPRTHCKQQRRARCLSVVCRLPASGLQRAWLFGYLAGQELRALQAPSSAYARAGEPLTRCAPARRADPGSWQIDPATAGDFANIFIYARAQIANKIGKPWILEETGMEARPGLACSAPYQREPRLGCCDGAVS
jgi:hypothetical protein